MTLQELQETYELDSKVGQGGFSQIIKARHKRLDQDVAIKAIVQDPDQVLEVRKEADILKSVSHSSLPKIFDFLNIDGTYCIVMEFIPGDNLTQYVQNHRTMNQKLLRNWAITLCDALHALHSAKPPVIHADIKPDNIILKAPEAKPMLIDFNVSRNNVGPGLVGYSKNYAAPEILSAAVRLENGQQVHSGPTVRSDLYSLAATLYFAAAGKPYSFQKPDFKILANKGYTPGFIEVLRKALSRDPRLRFSSAVAMKRAFSRVPQLDQGLINLHKQMQSRKNCLLAGLGVSLGFYILGLLLLLGQKVDTQDLTLGIDFLVTGLLLSILCGLWLYLLPGQKEKKRRQLLVDCFR